MFRQGCWRKSLCTVCSLWDSHLETCHGWCSKRVYTRHQLFCQCSKDVQAFLSSTTEMGSSNVAGECNPEVMEGNQMGESDKQCGGWEMPKSRNMRGTYRNQEQSHRCHQQLGGPVTGSRDCRVLSCRVALFGILHQVNNESKICSVFQCRKEPNTAGVWGGRVGGNDDPRNKVCHLSFPVCRPPPVSTLSTNSSHSQFKFLGKKKKNPSKHKFSHQFCLQINLLAVLLFIVLIHMSCVCLYTVLFCRWKLCSTKKLNI